MTEKNPMLACTLCEKEVAWKDWDAHKVGKVHRKSAEGKGDAALQATNKEIEDKAGYVARGPKPKKAPAAAKPVPKAANPGPQPQARYTPPQGRGGKGRGGYQNARPPATLLEPCSYLVNIKRSASSPPLGASFNWEDSSSVVRVSAVEAGSPASVAGLLPSLVVQKVNGSFVRTVSDVKKAVQEPSDLALVVVADSSGLLPGRVASWNKERGFGYICPLRPLFTQAGILGPSMGVYFGDIRCNSSSLSTTTSLAEGQEVEFEVQHDGRYFGVRTVRGVSGAKILDASSSLAGKNGGGGGSGLRAGADISEMVKTKEAVCMAYTAGRCSSSSSTSCAKGVHLKKPSSGKKAIPIIAAQSVKEVRFSNITSQGTRSNLCFTVDRKDFTMSYTNNGVVRGPFTHLRFDGKDRLEAVDIKKFVTVPVGKLGLVLGEIRCLAEEAKIDHNIPAGGEVLLLQESVSVPSVDEVMVKVSPSKLELLQQKWQEAGGYGGGLVNGWQLRNEDLEFRFRATEYNMGLARGRAPDMIDGFHGTAEDNVLSIAQNGFDPFRRSGQVYGEGEYFAKDPKVSVGYCRGGVFMFLCKLILGEAGTDHEWVPSMKYYIMKQREGNIQAIPMYLLQFQPTSSSRSPLSVRMSKVSDDEKEAAATLLKMGAKQRGGVKAEKGRMDTAMVARGTRHLWLGWLDPRVGRDDAELEKDVKEFLKGHQVKMVKPERNAARVGAFVELEEAVNKLQMAELNARLYRGEQTITVDNAQPDNPYMSGRPCPRLCGPSRYCRGWNLRGHCDWTEACSFKHDKASFVNFGESLRYERVPKGTAKYDELASEMERGGLRNIKGIRRIINKSQERAYESRRAFLNEKHGCVVEKELWHGTACSVLDRILEAGLQCPSDCKASEECPVSGGKGLATTLCGTDCTHCTERHEWKRCHMFGLGIYLADQADKSHRYVAPAEGIHSLVKCRVNLGNPYLIEGNLKKGDGLHDIVRCVDPSAFVDPLGDKKKVEWDLLKSHDSYYVKGLGSRAKMGYGVINSEYIIFQPAQVLPLYVVDYTC
eukprot:TRINITY_DN910_c0_g1_i1.p1 TRINITY_DN910_c0_g1~~TRINITY_DN910_c0_g1_i1.p1  ORF type:complete len:1049 (+),score=377.26 TRINITY_DN910_c0_g1_i1:50-3196(+)